MARIVPKPTAPAPQRRTLATFKATHDPATVLPNKIKAALERMRRDQGAEAYAYEVTDPEGGVPFSKLAGMGGNHLAQYRAQFMGHLVVTPGSIGTRRPARWVWFATVPAATKARGRPAKIEDFQ